MLVQRLMRLEDQDGEIKVLEPCKGLSKAKKFARTIAQHL